MKNNTTSFLFFLFVVSFFRCGNLFGQVASDSIAYYVEKVQNFSTITDLTEARNFFYRKLKSISNDDPYVLYYKYNLASVEKNMMNYDEAENLLVSILKDIDLLTDSFYKEQYEKAAFTLLGNLYRQQKNKEKAIELYNRALNKANSAIDSAVIYNNKSNIYRDFREFKNAKDELLSAYKLIPRLNNTLEQARILDNLGFVITELDSTSLGLEYIEKGLKLRQKIGINTEIIASYEKLIKYYLKKENDSLSTLYANKAYALSQKIKTIEIENNALGLLMMVHPDSKVRRFKKLNDSLSEIKFSGRNSYAIYEYDISELERQVFNEDLAKKQQQQKALLFAFLGGLILIVSTFLIILQRNRNKRHTLAQVHKTERNISKKVHDELGNDIFYLMNQLQTNPSSLLEKEGLLILNNLNDIYEKARDISTRYIPIDTGKGYHDQLISLLNSYSSDATRIVTEEVSPDFWDAVSVEKKEQLYRVLQELLTNMKKHSEASFAGITFSKIKKQIIVKYADNGKGATNEQLSVKNGLGNVENRIEEIGGTITFETSPSNGFKVEIRFIQ